MCYTGHRDQHPQIRSPPRPLPWRIDRRSWQVALLVRTELHSSAAALAGQKISQRAAPAVSVLALVLASFLQAPSFRESALQPCLEAEEPVLHSCRIPETHSPARLR